MTRTENRINKEVLLAISGGIDSAVAIYLLQQAGFKVHGVNFSFWHWEEDRYYSNEKSLQEIQEAYGITIERVDYRDQFKQIVVDPFISDQRAGLTPNPCVRCNPMVKFKLLISMADQQGAKYVSTGHYARVVHEHESGKFLLLTGMDKKKDQSYMLCYLNQEILSRTIFPLGHYLKEDIYKIGKQIGLSITEEKESQDLCFVLPEHYPEFLQAGIQTGAGEIINSSGTVLGMHNGLQNYTIGQRKGIRLSASKPYYVIRKEPAQNKLVVGFQEELDRPTFMVEDINWITREPALPLHADVKIRYHSKRIPGNISSSMNNQYKITLASPLQGVTPGQYAVFYDGDIVIGGGRISR